MPESVEGSSSAAGIREEYKRLGQSNYKIENYDGRNWKHGPKTASRGKLTLNSVPSYTVALGVFGNGGLVVERLAESAITSLTLSSERTRVNITRKEGDKEFREFDVIDVATALVVEDLTRRQELVAQLEEIRLQSKNLLPPVFFRKSEYLGGIPGVRERVSGILILNATGIGISPGQGRSIRGHLSWSDCPGVSVEGGEVAKSKIAPVLLFGVWGGLAAKGSKNQTVISARHAEGAVGYYLIDDASPYSVRAAIYPMLHAAGVPLHDDLPVILDKTEKTVSSVSDLDAQLRQLARLRDDGLLTDEEFAIQKTRLLSQ